MKNIKFFSVILALIGMISCQKEDKLKAGSDLEGRELVVYSIRGQYHYTNVNMGYGRTLLTMSFKTSNRGLHFKPDTALKVWDNFNGGWKRALGDTQSASFLSNYRTFLELQFDLPNEDIKVERFNQNSFIPTSVLSGDYQVQYGYLAGTGQKGWTLTKYDRQTNQPIMYSNGQQGGVRLVTIELLDR